MLIVTLAALNTAEVQVVSDEPAVSLERRVGEECWLYIPVYPQGDPADPGVVRAEIAVRYDPAVLQFVASGTGFDYVPGDMDPGARYTFRDTLRSDTGTLRRMTINVYFSTPQKAKGLLCGMRLRCKAAGVTKIAADAIRGYAADGTVYEGKLVQSNEVTVKVKPELSALLKVLE
jgi:hypothetical protein